MNNQILMWSILVLPWLTLFFMNKEDIKRLMPVALFSALASVFVVEMGENLGWFVYGETTYPLRTSFYIIFGLNSVTTMWLFRFICGQFSKYMVIDIVLNFGFVYLFHIFFLGNRGLFHEVGITPLTNVLITTIVGAFAYGYQMWQEGIFVYSERTQRTKNSQILQPEAAKPLGYEQQEDDEP